MKRVRIRSVLIQFVVVVFLAGCSYQQSFVKGEEIHARARWVAVLPLVNLSSYPHAGRIVGELLTTEMYALTRFQIMERTEMLEKLKGADEDLDQALERAVALKVGRSLGVDTIIYGSVTEFSYKRGLSEEPVVGITVRMLDVKEDRILWAGSQAGTGGCFWFCEDSLSRLAQKVCHEMVTRMVTAQ